MAAAATTAAAAALAEDEAAHRLPVGGQKSVLLANSKTRRNAESFFSLKSKNMRTHGLSELKIVSVRPSTLYVPALLNQLQINQPGD